jgi:hypothetical protein
MNLQNRLDALTLFPPGPYDDASTTSALDASAYDGPHFVLVTIGALDAGSTVSVRIDDSPTQATWTTRLTSPTYSAAGEYLLRVDRHARFLRATLTPSASANVSVTLLSYRKLV